MVIDKIIDNDKIIDINKIIDIDKKIELKKNLKLVDCVVPQKITYNNISLELNFSFTCTKEFKMMNRAHTAFPKTNCFVYETSAFCPFLHYSVNLITVVYVLDGASSKNISPQNVRLFCGIYKKIAI